MLSQAALEIMAESRAEGMAQGISQGLSQGISRGKADLLLRLMRRRFDNVPPATEQRVLMAEADDLDRWGEAVLDACTIEDVLSTPGIRDPIPRSVAPKRHERPRIRPGHPLSPDSFDLPQCRALFPGRTVCRSTASLKGRGWIDADPSKASGMSTTTQTHGEGDEQAPKSLFAVHEKVYPKSVAGKYRKLKWAALVILLAIYYIVPWLRWDRGPTAPDQAVLVDLTGPRLYFFFIEIWPQEVYYLTGLLIMAAVGLFLATSLAGRIWCGYACPQTVWTDLYVWIERKIEGDRSERIRLDKSPLSMRKVLKKLYKHLAWLVVAFLTGGAWAMYFTDAPTLVAGLCQVPGRRVVPDLHRPLHVHHIPAGRLGAGAGLHLHVPLAADPGRHDRRGQPRRHI